MNDQIVEILQWTLDEPYQYGTNDCNLTVLKIIDLIAGTTLSNREYTNIKDGIEGLKADGFNHVGEVVLKYCEEVEYLIDGDIWLDPNNPLIMGCMASGRLIGVSTDHSHFELQPKPTEGKFYRVINNKLGVPNNG